MRSGARGCEREEANLSLLYMNRESVCIMFTIKRAWLFEPKKNMTASPM